jgi:ketosteroid isomerase-like protein
LRVDSIRETGPDEVLVLGVMSVRGRGSGLELDQETGWLLRLRAGRALRLQAFLSHAEALAAAGVER